VYAALTYYFDNRDEIGRSIEEDEAFVAEMRKTAGSVLGQKLKP
jgi:outer membrane lipopolysaccharide assembly protein LptE/RlpB